MRTLWGARLKAVMNGLNEYEITIEIPNHITDRKLIKEIRADKRRCFDVEEYGGHGLIHFIGSVWAYDKAELVKHYTKSLRMLLDDPYRDEDVRSEAYRETFKQMKETFGDEFPELFI